MGGQVVIDSTNLDAIVADYEQTQAELTGIARAEPPGEAPKPEEGKAPVQAEGTEPDGVDEDVEDPESGLTAREKRELTAKMQAAIGKRTKALRSAEEFAAEQYNTRRLAEAKAAELEREVERLRASTKPEEPAAAPKEPTREAFASDVEYQSALIDYKVEQKLAAQRAADEARHLEKQQAQVLAAASARIKSAIDLVPDFVEVTGAIDWPAPPAVAGYMQESELFAELGYYLAKHPEARERLDSLSPSRQLVEIGKIESKIQPFAPSSGEKVKQNGTDTDPKPSPSNGAKPSTETGTAPSPRASAPVIRPLSSASVSQVEKSEADMSAQEALRAWQKKKHVNLTRRSRH